MEPALIALVSVIALLVVSLGLVTLVRRPRRTPPPAAPTREPPAPGVGDDATEPRDTPRRVVEDVRLPPDHADVATLPEPTTVPESLTAPESAPPALEQPAPALGRMARLRGRLARSQSTLGRGLLAILARDRLDEATWEELEDLLLGADVGVAAAEQLVSRLRERARVEGWTSPQQARSALRAELLAAVEAGRDRQLHVQRQAGRPAVVLVVGVNGTGKTTTVGKLARLLVAENADVLLGAADTFRAAAAEQLTTWGERVGVPVVRGPEGADPGAVAFDALSAGLEGEADVVVIDTAGRLHTKVGLMDELGKIKRVLERRVGTIDEVLLVLDATTGQNGLTQARVFADVVDVTGIVLTKLDGTAKGGIVIAVQQELGVPVKLVGLGEGPDDLAPFDPQVFVDALLDQTSTAP